MNVEMLHLPEWEGAARDMASMLLQEPATNGQFWIFFIVAFMTARWTIMRVVQTMNMNDLGTLQYFIVTGLAIGAIILSLAAVQIYMPKWLASPDSTWYIAGIIAGASLFLSVPLINVFMHENYFKTLLAWMASMAAMVGMIMIMGVLADAFFEGVQSFEKGQKRNAETQQILK